MKLTLSPLVIPKGRRQLRRACRDRPQPGRTGLSWVMSDILRHFRNAADIFFSALGCCPYRTERLRTEPILSVSLSWSRRGFQFGRRIPFDLAFQGPARLLPQFLRFILSQREATGPVTASMIRRTPGSPSFAGIMGCCDDRRVGHMRETTASSRLKSSTGRRQDDSRRIFAEQL